MPPGADILALFEQGRPLHPVDRALLLLARACPELPAEALAAVPLGRRDECLLRLRARLFGDPLPGRARCPGCGEELEVEASCGALLARSAPAPGPRRVQLGASEFTVRPVDSRDLAATTACRTVEEAQAVLLARCVGDDGVDPAALTAAERLTLAEAVASADPGAETLLQLSCPGCGHRWDVALEVGDHLWSEVDAEARRLLREVDLLARTYGWSEGEILRLGDARRRLYVEMALS